MKDYIVKKTVRINAPAEVVWDALTDPEKTKEYFFNCRVISNWKPGSPITFKGRMFWIIPFKIRGVIKKATPGKLLQYTLRNGKGKSTSTVTDELIEKDGKTELHITDEVGQGEGAEQRYHRSVKGWDKILKGLKELVENES
ncbi:SRPBCC domain-containing protein [Mucilaginibacter corticis]|uniref:SRPBCC domain-containing protein n=1 Tax=Mucilaginibacter corticis TaxID=2597670 RepID=A0A556M4V9_9SPHI|nr:SRPBCC domain-containing protein [Mucilaginibacter corticis]TSJ34901.1 SRPBCC domain-containing protein [Mucilaginibacter corticis]